MNSVQIRKLLSWSKKIQRKLKLSDQLKKVNEIIEGDFKETSIITNEEAIIKIIPMQSLNIKFIYLVTIDF